jgi:hypothetical protein
VRRGHIEIFVGPQIETDGLTDEQVSVMAERFQAFTADFVERGELGDVAHLDPRHG